MFFFIKNIEFNIVTRILLKSIFITDKILHYVQHNILHFL